MDLHPDFKDLLAEFARFEVKYALLGGYAVGYHAKPRATKEGRKTLLTSHCWSACKRAPTNARLVLA